VGFLGQVRDKDIEQTVAVHISDGNSHVGLGSSHGVVGNAAGHGLLLEGAVALVNPEVVGLPIVGDQDIWPTVAVEVGAKYTQARPGTRPETCLFAHVLET